VTTPVDDLMAALHQADAAIQSGRYQEARRLLDQTLAAHPDAAKAHYLHGVSLAMLGERREAHAGFVRAAELAPGDAALQCYAAAASREFGRAAEAMQYCRAALAADPNCGPAYELLAAVELPGEHYMKLLERIHAHLRPRTYIEIGIFAGASFGLAGAGRPGSQSCATSTPGRACSRRTSSGSALSFSRSATTRSRTASARR
jgi:tetratricopeptide (TPR) repeat protein